MPHKYRLSPYGALNEGNHIQNLTDRSRDLQTQINTALLSIQVFEKHLSGSKYQGTDERGARKDWISTTDVLRWLTDIKGDLTWKSVP
jgi:hypothetical protein